MAARIVEARGKVGPASTVGSVREPMERGWGADSRTQDDWALREPPDKRPSITAANMKLAGTPVRAPVGGTTDGSGGHDNGGGRGEWGWGEELHGDLGVAYGADLRVESGMAGAVGRWTFHDAYCGIGNATAGLELAGGKCTGCFDRCPRARRVYLKRFGREPGGSSASLKEGQFELADVLYSAPPCEASSGAESGQRQMWRQLELVDEYRYKVVVIEQLLRFRKLQAGTLFRDFVGELNQRGYVTSCQIMRAQCFGSAAARKRLVVVGVRRDIHERSSDFEYPAGSRQRHPLRSVLEPEFFRRPAHAHGGQYTALAHARQQSPDSLRQVGVYRRGPEGFPVYSTDGPASAQMCRGHGPGWTSGLYLVNGKVSRLLVGEVKKLLQVEEDVELDAVEAVALRQLGGSTAVGQVRALGVEIERLLARAQVTEPARRTSAPRPRGLTAAGVRSQDAMHAAKMVAWQAMTAAQGAAAASEAAAVGTIVGRLPEHQAGRARRAVRELERRRWHKLQRRRGLEEMSRMREAGVDAILLQRAKWMLDKALWLEWQRQGVEDGPINLLWWNWSGPIPEELIAGYKLPLRRPPPPSQPDNYDSANVEKVWKEFARMTDRGYMEGPFDHANGNVYMTHPLAAVPKKGSDKLRIVIDMTATMLNECLVAHRFILPQVQDVAARCYPGAWLMTAGLVDGFYGVEVREEDRKYLGLRHPRTGKYYRYTRLAMGAACSPAAFSRLVAWAVKEADEYPEFKVERVVVNDTDPNMPRVYGVGRDGLPVATSDWFVDDGCIVAPTRERVVAAYKRLVWLLEARLGWRICQRKTEGPAQQIVFTGLVLDTIGADVGGPCTRLTAERREKCASRLQEFLGAHAWGRKASRRDMASLVGELSFAANAVPAGRCFLARLYDAVHEVGRAPTGDALDYDRKVDVTKEAVMDLRWWERALDVSPCVVLWRSGSFALHRCWSDASNYGFAESLAVDEHEELPQMAFTHGVWPDALAQFSSNWHELATIVHSIRTRALELRGAQVHYMTDNTTSVKAVNTGTVRSPQLMKLSRELKLLQARYNIGVEAIHLPGRMMMKQGTDGASRQAPWLGMYSGGETSHDLFSPVDWPCFKLNGSILESISEVRSAGTLDGSPAGTWDGRVDWAGRDVFCHVRPCHAQYVLGRLLEAQLRRGTSTSFTVVVPQVGMRAWSKFLKHFRRREVHNVLVPGLGPVKHWFLRFEPGDGLLPRGGERLAGSERGEVRGDDMCAGSVVA